MMRMLIRTLVFLGSAAIGLLVAAAVLDDVSVTASGFILVVVLYAVIQSVIAPFLMRVAAKSATAFLGGVGLVATFVALLAASWFGDSLTITGGAVTWISATVIVWLATAIATLLLPMIIVKTGVQRARENN
jgi:Mycobacterial 4 TMS phage holin, superfamily IV